MARKTKFIGIGFGVAVVLVVGAVLALHHATPPPPPPAPHAALIDPSIAPGDYPARFLAMQVSPPDADMTQQPGVDCSTGTGLYTTRCVFNFTDAARYNQTDQLVVYTLTNDGDYAALQSQMEATLNKLPNGSRLAEDESDGFSNDKTGQVAGHIKFICEQAAGSGIVSDGVCMAHYAPGVAVAAAVFPLTSLDGINLSAPPDMERAEDLEGAGLFSIYETIGIP